MNDRVNRALDVMSGQESLKIGMDTADLVKLFAAIFLAMLLANLTTKLIA